MAGDGPTGSSSGSRPPVADGRHGDDPAATIAHTAAAIARHLPPHVAEVLLPALTIVPGPGRALLVPYSAAWSEVLDRHVGDALRLAGLELGLALLVADQAPSLVRSASFAETLADPGNQLALAACRRAAEAPGLEHNPLYLHGPPGSGKSHLLAATAAEARRLLGDDAVVELDGHEFVAGHAQELVEGGDDGADGAGLRTRLERALLITLDDVQALGGRALAQEGLFHLINRALDQGQQLVIAGDQPPRRLAGFEERLTTRLAWGLVAPLEPPHLETRVALLRKLAGKAADHHDGAKLTALVESHAGDLHRVVELSRRLISGEELTAPSPTSVDRLIELVAERLHLRPSDIAGKRRHRAVVTARQLVLWLARRHGGRSLAALGGLIGGRDHTTVLHALRRAEDRMASDAEFRRIAEEVGRAAG